ncbi:MAG: hypothetical protein OEX19_02105 [Gammaproteobacteria bacterium]|nr:hypothetical protein [Gammaproteobacteria bacterium]
MVLITIIIIIVLGVGWLSAEYGFRTLKTQNKLLKDRQQVLDHQLEQFKVALEAENRKVIELEELSSEAAAYRDRFDKSASDLKRYEEEIRRMEKTLLGLKERASSKEYFGNALGNIFVESIDKLLLPRADSSTKLSDSARDVFQKAKKNING